MTDEQYSILKSFANNFIRMDQNLGIDIRIENLDSYIERAITLLKYECDEKSREKLHTELEYENGIIHEAGSVIFDNYEERHDWYSNSKISDNFFWRRYKDYLLNKTSINRKSINLLEDVTLPEILNCLNNPNDKPLNKIFKRGLIIGDVQSGKTATYIGLICKAADAGFKVVILLAGITESLRKQTQERVDEGVIGMTLKKIGKNDVRRYVGVKGPLKATSYTTALTDFIGECDKIVTSLSSHNSLVVFVVKKNVSVLRKLFQWLKEQNIDPDKGYVDVPMLLIDDEADNASVNTKKEETDPTKTNEIIRKICHLFLNSTYVGFTATPFANVFIDPDSVDSMKRADLFPENFIYALEAPSNYVGADKIFYEDGKYYGNLRFITDIEEPDYTSEEYKETVKNDIDFYNKGPFYYRHKKEWNGILPDSLREAVLCFFITNVIRDLRGQKREPRSMLINMSRFIKVQRIITDHIEHVYNNVFNDIRHLFTENDYKNKKFPLYTELNNLWKKHFNNIHDIKFEKVVSKKNLIDAIEKIQILTVNGSKQSSKLDYRSNPSLRVIAIGGLALSRGLTLEGLMVSYFYRNTSTFDVLMQMGRWFGYRNGYEDIFQIWTSEISARWYAEVAKASQELKNDIRHMFDQRLTPKDFGIKVRDNCDELQITASNKMRSATSVTVQYSYYGNIYDTPYISYNINHNKNNIKEVEKLTSRLFVGNFKWKYADYKKENKNVHDFSDGSSRFFEDVPKQIIIDFLSNIKCSVANPRFNTETIVEFLNNNDNLGLDYWNVVFEGGDSKLKYCIPGLETINYSERTICHSNRNLVQISTRRRVLGLREGKFSLTKEEIEYAENTQRTIWGKKGELYQGRNIPIKAYYEYLPQRKPVLIILLIHPSPPDTKGENERMIKFREQLGTDPIVAFAVGCPGRKNVVAPISYKANKIFQYLNIEGEEPEEIDDEE